MRYFIELAYNGKNYHGWQRQPDAISVQEDLEDALSTILQKDMKVVGAGRTDTGVHAKQLFVHFNFTEIEDLEKFAFKLNTLLSKDILVREIKKVREDVHARFDATEREYEYVISQTKNPFLKDFTYLIHKKPNVDKMNEAAKVLFEYIDFQCFSKSKTGVKTYNCDIRKAYWEQKDDQLVFTISADRFLRNMVRAIVGTLLEVGFEKITIAQFHEVINSKNRSNAGTSAPAHALYLTKVLYPKNIYL